ncbi:hypothetical protein [Singulisphaera acidiphila]|nr:hypothetical protein [Singulisphaera acidiphila]
MTITTFAVGTSLRQVEDLLDVLLPPEQVSWSAGANPRPSKPTRC